MNQEKLNHIATNPSEITADDARELDELTRNFPYFTLPYVLLSKYYSNTHDYRFEELLHKTALRVSDREWLHQFIHGNVLETNHAEVSPSIHVEPMPLDHTAEPVEESIVPISEVQYADVEMEKPVPVFEPSVEFAPEPEMAEVNAKVETEAMVEIEEPAEQTMSEEIEIPLSEFSSIFEIDTEKPITIEEPEDEVYDEIGSFDEIIPESVIATQDSQDLSSFELREVIIEPAVESDTPAENEKPANIPEIPIEATVEPQRKPAFSTGGVYNIEDYYPSSLPTDKPVDFFGWLSNPAFTAETPKTEDSEPKQDKKTELIAQFIKNNPSVSAPKSEFFHAAEVAKKSEELPQGLVTETLASVYMQQGNYSGAIRIYENLILKIPQKSTYFAALIEKIKKEHNL